MRLRLLNPTPLLCLCPGLLLAQSYTTTTVAGATWLKDGTPAVESPLRSPWGVAQDTDGTIYLADARDHRIRKISPSGTISTLAGIGLPLYGGDGGPAARAGLDTPHGLKLDGKGNLFFCDWNNGMVRKIDLATGVITKIAGSGSFTFAGDGGPATQAGMDCSDVAVDRNGNVYIADQLNNRIRKVTASTGQISTIAGTGTLGAGGDGGSALTATLALPVGIAVDAQGVVYVADGFTNNRVRRIDPSNGTISTIAGNGSFANTGDEGPANQAGVNFPQAVSIDSNGDLVILTATNIRRVTLADRIIHRVAGNNTQTGYAGDGGPALAALFLSPTFAAAAPNGDILISDFGNFRLRRVRGQNVETVSGIGIQENARATSAYINAPIGVVADDSGGFWVSDFGHRRVRAVASGNIVTTAAGYVGFPDGLSRDGSTFYVADSSRNTVFSSVRGGAITVLAGNAQLIPGFSGDGGLATSARLNVPVSAVPDGAGNLYIADFGNCRIRMIDRSGVISTLAGTGTCGFSGDSGPASQARVWPVDLAYSNGNLYVAESRNNRVRKIDLSTKIITTFAGTGVSGYSGDGGPATAAQLSGPTGVTADAGGNLYIADRNNALVRVVRGATISSIAGTGILPFFNGESGPASSIAIDPLRLSAAPDGSILVADMLNDRIRRIVAVTASSLGISGGQGQSGSPGEQVRLTVRVLDAGGLPIAGVPVNFAVTTGTAQLSSPTVQSDLQGNATVTVTLGQTLGAVTVTASTAGVSAVTFNLTIVAAGPPLPRISDGGVVGAALSIPAVRALSTGGIASIFGANFGAGAAFQRVGPADLVGGQVPTIFKGICVEVGGTRAPMFGASDNQVNFQVPQTTAGSATVVVIVGCGTSAERRSSAASVTVQAASPEFFYFVTNANGTNPVAATDSVTGGGIAPQGLFAGFSPARPSQYVTVYATGFGATSPPVTPGTFPENIASVSGAVRVFLNDRELPAANVLYAGVTPQSPGLYQVNLLLPADTPEGNLSLVIQIGNVRSRAGAFLAVRGGGILQ